MTAIFPLVLDNRSGNKRHPRLATMLLTTWQRQSRRNVRWSSTNKQPNRRTSEWEREKKVKVKVNFVLVSIFIPALKLNTLFRFERWNYEKSIWYLSSFEVASRPPAWAQSLAIVERGAELRGRIRLLLAERWEITTFWHPSSIECAAEPTLLGNWTIAAQSKQNIYSDSRIFQSSISTFISHFILFHIFF